MKLDATPPPMEDTKNASSVFRKSDRGSGGGGETQRGGDPNSPSRILLSLKTPPASFDERDKKVGNGSPLSPEEPPQIQHIANTKHGHTSSNFSPRSLFFEGS